MNCCSINLNNILNEQSNWYSIALKKPKGTNYFYWNSYQSNQTSFQNGSDINQWIYNCFTKSQTQWTHQLLYNDQLPVDDNKLNTTMTMTNNLLKGFNKNGHCKGIVLWNTHKVGWLFHSIPKYPNHALSIPFTKSSNFPKIDESELLYGQSLIYIEMPFIASSFEMKNIFEQLAVMDAQIYYTSFSQEKAIVEFYSEDKKNKMQPILSTLSLPFQNIVHYAKSHHFIYDLYDTYLTLRHIVPNTGTLNAKNKINKEKRMPILCETWIRGQELEPTQYTKNIKTLSEWTETQDHSKWAISMPYSSHFLGFIPRPYKKNKYRVCLGDLNRMHSQTTRGGGFLVIDNNKELWTCFYEMIKTYKDQKEQIITL